MLVRPTDRGTVIRMSFACVGSGKSFVGLRFNGREHFFTFAYAEASGKLLHAGRGP